MRKGKKTQTRTRPKTRRVGSSDKDHTFFHCARWNSFSVASFLFIYLVITVAVMYIGLTVFLGTLPGERGRAVYISWSAKTVVSAGAIGSNPSLALNSFNVPIASFVDETKGVLMFAQYVGEGRGNCETGSDWSCTVVDDKNVSADDTTILLNSTGNSIISYVGENQIKVAQFTGTGTENTCTSSNWSCQAVHNVLLSTVHAAMSLNASNNPILAFNYSSSLRVAEFVGDGTGSCSNTNWNCAIVDPNGGDFPAITRNSANNPVISYYRRNSLHFAEYVGETNGNCTSNSAWSCETIDSKTSKNVGEYSSIHRDSLNNLRVSYYDRANGDLRLATFVAQGGNCTSTRWNCELVDNSGDVGQFSSITSGSLYQPIITYISASIGMLKFAEFIGSENETSCASTNWRCTTVDYTTRSTFNFLVFNRSLGIIQALYYDTIRQNLKFAQGITIVTQFQISQDGGGGGGGGGPGGGGGSPGGVSRNGASSGGVVQSVSDISWTVDTTTPSITLTWKDPVSFTLRHIEILRNYPFLPGVISGDAYSVVAKGIEAYKDTGVTLGNTYTYIIKAVDKTGIFANSDVIVVALQEAPTSIGGGTASEGAGGEALQEISEPIGGDSSLELPSGGLEEPASGGIGDTGGPIPSQGEEVSSPGTSTEQTLPQSGETRSEILVLSDGATPQPTPTSPTRETEGTQSPSQASASGGQAALNAIIGSLDWRDNFQGAVDTLVQQWTLAAPLLLEETAQGGGGLAAGGGGGAAYEESSGYKALQEQDSSYAQVQEENIDVVNEEFGLEDFRSNDVFLYFDAIYEKTGEMEEEEKKIDVTKEEKYKEERYIAPAIDKLSRLPSVTDKRYVFYVKFYDRGNQKIRYRDGVFLDESLSTTEGNCELLETLSAKEYAFLSEHRLNCYVRQQFLEHINQFVKRTVASGGIVQELYNGVPRQELFQLRAGAQETTGQEYADLEAVFRIFLTQESGYTGEDVCSLQYVLGLGGIVEYCYLEPETLLPGIIGVSYAQETNEVKTHDFTGLQGYLNDAPSGVSVRYGWSVPGGKGEHVKVIDVEGGWQLGHEDMPQMFFAQGNASEDGLVEHGTSVVGEVCGIENQYGITGIANKAQCGVVSYLGRGVGSALALAVSKLKAGDVLLVELQGQGPRSGKRCECNCKQFEQIPMEYWYSVYDILEIATGLGISVVEASGNGSMDLDSDIYQGTFNRGIRDSGAIIVGGGQSKTREGHCWTNYGGRVDMQGWGDSVVTLGYGDLWGEKEDEYYTEEFEGTSSAAPIAAGAAAILQSIYFEMSGGTYLAPVDIRRLLVDHGTLQGGDKKKHIGPLPDLKKTIETLLKDKGVAVIQEAGKPIFVSRSQAMPKEISTPRISRAVSITVVIAIVVGIGGMILGGIHILRIRRKKRMDLVSY